MTTNNDSNPSKKKSIRLAPLPELISMNVVGGLSSIVQAVDLIKAKTLHEDHGLTGAGMVAAVIDTGFFREHDGFKFQDGTSGSRIGEGTGIPASRPLNQEPAHGTAVAALICARFGSRIGVAPDAEIDPIAVGANSDVESSFKYISKALQLVIEKVEAGSKISVVNLSHGDMGNYKDEEEAMDAAGGLRPKFEEIAQSIKRLEELNVPVVVASGNSYGEDAQPGMCFPAILQNTISVGGVLSSARDSNGATSVIYNTPGRPSTRFRVVDHIAPFAQRLGTDHDGDHFTNFLGPATPISSLGTTDADGNPDPQAVVLDAHGTSFAAPAVAGVILLLQQWCKEKSLARPTVQKIKDWLSVGETISDADHSDDDVPGTGSSFTRIDAQKAFDAMVNELSSS